MFKKTKNAISVIWTFFRFCIIKLLRWKEFHWHWIERFSPGTMVNVYKKGRLELGKKVRAHSNVRISVTPGGRMTIGDNVRMNYNCIFVCKEEIVIGNGVEFGPNVVVYDHDHDFKCVNGIKANRFTKKPIHIGENTWIGAGAMILKGASIGANCVIGAGSIVTGSIPDGALFYQKKEGITQRIVQK